MSIWEGVVLGIVQGLTELLPVSSSAHLVIVQSFIKGFHQPGVLFDVILHLGTLFAVIFFFRKDILDITKALIPGKWLPVSFRRDDSRRIAMRRKMALLIIIGTLPAGIAGLLFKDAIHGLFESVGVAAAMLLITGVLLFLSDQVKNADRQEDEMNITDGIVIGMAQAVALIPGISRSGSTIAFGIFRRLDRETAARFSFLLSIPAITGAAVLESRYLTSIPASDLPAYGIGFLMAAITGFMSLKFLFLIIKKKGLKMFAYYCWFVGCITLILQAS
ncbi:MAG: undecaprenyl-diphosphate phosphatase [Deltaproteobacteria bacterium]